jgi:hypothetical protein
MQLVQAPVQALVPIKYSTGCSKMFWTSNHFRNARPTLTDVCDKKVYEGGNELYMERDLEGGVQGIFVPRLNIPVFNLSARENQ